MAENPGWKNITPLTSETAKIVGAKGGAAKKGSKHINTYIQELMEDESFEANILDAKKGVREYKGAPIKAIVGVAIVKAVNGDAKAMDWLAKYGWAQKVETDVTTNGESINGSVDPAIAASYADFLKGK
jgi:hypothetical protein